MMLWVVRVCGVGAAALIGVVAAAGPAAAMDPPDIDGIVSTTPADPPPKPPVRMQQKTQCAVSALLARTVTARPAPANAAFNVDELHRFATGAGVTVAVIDSGVAPNARLPRLRGGGDYIGTGTGLDDCDHHGTLVAGIIGAQPSADDGFIGVAPDASLISIRQTSSAYQPADTQRRGSDDTSGSTLSTLASAIVRSANLGAKVINLSVTACFDESKFVDTSDLAEALKYAVDAKDSVIVTAAGNANDSCTSNPGYDPGNAQDPRNWVNSHVVSMPSYYSPLVLSVGGADLTGGVYPATMSGPWVGVAAPAEDIVSLDPTKRAGGLTNATVGDKGPETIAGTSFASAYVAGLAALIRQKWPALTAPQVRERIVQTAHAAAVTQQGAFGAGTVDPVAALTWSGAADPHNDAPASRSVPQPRSGVDARWVKALVAIGGAGVVILGAAAAVGAIRLSRRATAVERRQR